MSASSKKPTSFEVKILRQDGPQQSSRWERYDVPYEPNMNVISVLQKVAAMGVTTDGTEVAPVAWDCNCLEEVCGACTMLVNTKTRQACTALVDPLLKENPTIELQPMSKYPVVRDLMVDRARVFRTLEKVKAWIPVDGYYDLGPGPRQSQAQQEMAYPMTECMTCGCCMEACPQYTKIELERYPNESDADYETRCNTAYDTAFLGAAPINQAMLMNENPTGAFNASERLDAMAAPGGLQICGNAQNCVAVCPKEIELTYSIARAGRATTLHTIKSWFDN